MDPDPRSRKNIYRLPRNAYIKHTKKGLFRYFEAETNPRIKHTKKGLLSMVNCGDGMLGSQFFFTLGTLYIVQLGTMGLGLLYITTILTYCHLLGLLVVPYDQFKMISMPELSDAIIILIYGLLHLPLVHNI